MYMHVKKLAAITLPLLLSILLSACGGAPADGTSSNQSSAANKPTQPSSIESSSAPSSMAQSSIPGLTESSSTSTATSSLSRSSTETYVRASRTSSSSSSASGSDSTPPEPTELLLYRLSESSITLIWDDATDNVSVDHYNIERNGKLIAAIAAPVNILSDQKLQAYTDYSYTITAFDASGNKSATSPVLTIRTLANANSSIAMSSSSKSASSQNSSNSSSSMSSQDFKSSSSSSSSTGQQSVTLTWTHPTQRENGQYLELDEISGYEIRYRKRSDSRFTYILINSNKVTEYKQSNANDLEFEIAVFDNRGVYSRFAKVAQ